MTAQATLDATDERLPHWNRMKLLQQHQTPKQRHRHRQPKPARLPVGSALNGLDRFLEPRKRVTVPITSVR